MFTTHPEAFNSNIAAQRRSEFALAAQHARTVRILKKERKKSRQDPPTQQTAKPRCNEDVG